MEFRPVIFLNGPPRCGKDTLAQHIAETIPGFKVVKFAKILKERTHALYGKHRYVHDAFEDTKDMPHADFLGLTPREAYIAVSENLMKPIHGKAVWGKMLLNEMKAEPNTTKAFIVSDSGFSHEAFPIIDHFGDRNCRLIRIRAEARGCSFEKDSRSYIQLPITSFDLNNNRTKDQFLSVGSLMIQNALQSMVGGG